MKSATAEPEVRLPMPHAGQRVVLSNPARFRFVSAGRRWRKTTMAMEPVFRAMSSGKEIMWGAPTYDQCRTAWDEFFRAAGGIADFKESRLEIHWPGGGKVLFRSMDDPNNARSKTAHGFVMDEAAYCHPKAWTEVMRPILSDTGGWALLLSTPRGRNWYWQAWQAARAEMQGMGDSAAWSAPTLGVRIEDGRLIRAPHPLENPHFSFDEAVKLWQQQPERTFRQEFMAEFVEDGGGVFRRVDEAVRSGKQERAIPGHQYAFGVDWGRHEDFTVIAVVDLHLRACVLLDRMREIDFPTQSQRLQVWIEKFRPKTVIAEKNSFGQPVIEYLQKQGFPISEFHTTNETKRTAIEALALAFERSDISIPNDEVLTGELKAFQQERLPSGLLRYAAPEGMHDDTVMALAMAWQAVPFSPLQGTVKIPQPSWSRRA